MGEGEGQADGKLSESLRGGRFEDLRSRSADELSELDFPGWCGWRSQCGNGRGDVEQVIDPPLPARRKAALRDGCGDSPQLLKMIGLGS